MHRWTRHTLLTAGAVLGAGAVALVAGTVAWNRATARALSRLLPAGAGAERELFSPDELAGLPAPVARYFRFALTPGQPIVRRARIEHAGEFRTALGRPWSPFTSVQHFATRPAGYVWDATIHLTPLLPVRVRDSYLADVGSMLGRFAALVPVVDESGSPEIAASALHRYLLEAPWFPTALLPSQGVQWEAIDDSTARATLQDHGIRVSADFHFGARGEIVRTTALRFRDVEGTGVPTPFTARGWSYQRRGGMTVPTEGEVEWTLPEGRFTYWRGRITAAEYEPASD